MTAQGDQHGRIAKEPTGRVKGPFVLLHAKEGQSLMEHRVARVDHRFLRWILISSGNLLVDECESFRTIKELDPDGGHLSARFAKPLGSELGRLTTSQQDERGAARHRGRNELARKVIEECGERVEAHAQPRFVKRVGDDQERA